MYMKDSLVNLSICEPNTSVNHWTDYTGELFFVVKSCIEQPYFSDCLITEEWGTNVQQILGFFLLLDSLCYLKETYLPYYLPVGGGKEED